MKKLTKTILSLLTVSSLAFVFASCNNDSVPVSTKAATEKATVTEAPVTAEHIHEYVKKSTTATCLEVGKALYECVCGDSYEETERPLGHDYSDTLYEKTEKDDEYMIRNCKRCSLTVKEYTDKEENSAYKSLNSIFEGKARETVYSSDIGSSFSMHFPDFVTVGNEIWGYYITYSTGVTAGGENKGGVGLAVSKDNGATFENRGCVIYPGEDYDCLGAYFAGVWYEESEKKFYLVYEAKGTINSGLESIALATSNDGINWSKEGVILSPTFKTWQRANVGTPDLFKEGNTWYLTFHGFDYNVCRMGLAYGTDLHDLTVLEDPIIDVSDNPEDVDSGTVGRRDVIKVGDTYFMVYEVSSVQKPGVGYAESKWCHKFARSKDMINWETIEKPLIPIHDGFGNDGPAFIIIKGKVYVYYRNERNCTTRALIIIK